MEQAASRCEPGGEHRIALGGCLDRHARQDLLTQAALLRECSHSSATIDFSAVVAVDLDGLDALGRIVEVVDARYGTVTATSANDDVRLALELAELGEALLVLAD